MNNNICHLLQHFETSNSNTNKFIFKNHKSNGLFETSCFIRNEDTNIFDICVSSMAGCPMKCKICATTYSNPNFERLLTTEEILHQVYFAIKKKLHAFNHNTKIIVSFTGNGEPFANFDQVYQSIKTLIEKPHIKTIHQINLSTIGYNISKTKLLAEFVNKTKAIVKLQFSLISINDKTRQKIIPMGIKLNDAIEYLDNYARITGIPVKYNIPLIKNTNDSHEHLNLIADFILEQPKLRTLKLACYNTFTGAIYNNCSTQEIYQAANYLANLGVTAKIFFGDRNKNIYATCGLLRKHYNYKLKIARQQIT